MPPQKHHFHDAKYGAAIAVRVTPRASKNEITGIQEDGTIKIRLTAAPVEGQANRALIQYLADLLKVAASKVEIVAGQTGRDKLITITGMSAEDVQKAILKASPK